MFKTYDIYGVKELVRQLKRELKSNNYWDFSRMLECSTTPSFSSEGFMPPLTAVPVEGNTSNTYLLVGSSGQQRILRTGASSTGNSPDECSSTFVASLATLPSGIDGNIWTDFISESPTNDSLFISRREIYFSSNVKLTLYFEGRLNVEWRFSCFHSDSLRIYYSLGKTEENTSKVLETASSIFTALSTMDKKNVVDVFNYFAWDNTFNPSEFVAEYSNSLGRVLHSITAKEMEIISYKTTVDSSAIYTAATCLLDKDMEMSKEEKEALRSRYPKTEKVTYTVTAKNWTFENMAKTFCFCFSSSTDRLSFEPDIHVKFLPLLPEVINVAKKEAIKVYHELPLKWKS